MQRHLQAHHNPPITLFGCICDSKPWFFTQLIKPMHIGSRRTRLVSLHISQPFPPPLMRQLIFQPNLGCGICYDKVDQASSATSMHCCHHTHIVHHHCALQWYVKQRQQNLDCSCPFCRTTVFTPAQFDQIYTFKDGPVSPPEDILFPDADGPLFPRNIHMVQLTYFSYIFMLVNTFFIFVILFKMGQ